MKILISDSFDASLPKRLEAFGEVTTDLAEAHVLLIRSKTKVTQELADRAPNLKLVIRGGVGLDNVDKEVCKAKGIKVMNTPAASSVAVAEMAMAFMLAIPARLIEAHTAMKAGQFPKSELKRTECFQKTLGLIGCGAIATEVARRAQAFGMKVIGYDPFLTSHPVAELKTLDEVLAQADFISCHTPLTDQTKGMFNAERFRQMKDGVILINTGPRSWWRPTWPRPWPRARCGPTARTCGSAIPRPRTAPCSAPRTSSWPPTSAAAARRTSCASATP